MLQARLVGRAVDISMFPYGAGTAGLLRVEIGALSSNSIQSLANIKDGVSGIPILVSLCKLLR